MDGSLISLLLSLALLCCPGKVLQLVRGRSNPPALPPLILQEQGAGSTSLSSQHHCMADEGHVQISHTHALGAGSLALGPRQGAGCIPKCCSQLSWTQPHEPAFLHECQQSRLSHAALARGGARLAQCLDRNMASGCSPHHSYPRGHQHRHSDINTEPGCDRIINPHTVTCCCIGLNVTMTRREVKAFKNVY